MTLNLQTNPAAGLIHDEIEARGITASAAATALRSATCAAEPPT